MKKIYICNLLIILISSNIFSSSTIKVSESTAKYFRNYFKTKKYNITYKYLVIDNTRLHIAAHYENKKKLIIDKAIVFELREGEFVPQLFINKHKITNRKNEIIIDVSVHPYSFFGWQIDLSIPKDKPNRNYGFIFTYIADKGSRITDGPIVYWDKKVKLFRKFEINATNYD